MATGLRAQALDVYVPSLASFLCLLVACFACFLIYLDCFVSLLVLFACLLEFLVRFYLHCCLLALLVCQFVGFSCFIYSFTCCFCFPPCLFVCLLVNPSTLYFR